MNNTFKTKFNKITTAILYNPLYIVLLGFITFYSWYTLKSAVGIAVLLSITAVVLVINKDILPAMPNLIFSIYCTAKSDILDQKSDMTIMIIASIILVIGLLFHMIVYRVKLNNIKKFKLTIPLIFVSIALAIGGLGVIKKKEYLDSITFILSLGVLMLFLYLFISLYLCPPDKIDAKRYICHCITILGLVVVAQALVAISKVEQKSIVDLMRQLLDVGWGNRNGIAMTIVLSMSASFYLAFTDKRFSFVHFLIPLLEYLLLFIVFSRAGILAATFEVICLVIYGFTKGSNRSHLIYAISIVSILMAIFALLQTEQIVEILDMAEDFFNKGTSSRDSLYAEAIKLFLQYPLFGAGVGYIGNIFPVPPHCMYWFHSTLFQIIGNMGIIGIIAYGIYYVARGVIMFSNPKQFNIVLSISIVAFELHSMLDVGTFNPFPYVFIVIFLTAFIEHNNSKSATYLSSIDINIH